jgi:hypothetical protein
MGGKGCGRGCVVSSLRHVDVIASLWCCVHCVIVHAYGSISHRGVVVWLLHGHGQLWLVVVVIGCCWAGVMWSCPPSLVCWCWNVIWVGNGKGGMKGTHYNDDDDDYHRCALSFVVVVAHHLSPLVCTVWLPRCRRDVAPASGKKKKWGEGSPYSPER